MAEKGIRKGLGAGLGALFGEDALKERDADILSLPISKVEPRADQPRRSFNAETLDELADSIREYGLIQPLTVRRLPNGYYQIVAGERRWRAARLAELAEVPVRVVEADDKRAMEMALVENLQREDLNPMEEARGLRILMAEYGLSQEEAALAVGKSRPAVANALRLLSLSPEVMEMVESGNLSAGHARTLLPLTLPERQLKAAMRVLNDGLSVRQTETLVARLLKEPPEAPAEAPAPDLRVNYLEEVRRDLERALARKVKITEGRKRGKIELEFYSPDDRESLIKSLLKLTSV